MASFSIGFSTPPMGAATANESISSVDFLLSGLFGMETPAYIQYRQNELNSGAIGPLPQGFNPGGGGVTNTTAAASGNVLLIGGLILLAFFLLK